MKLTVEIKGIEFNVTFDYQPEEPQEAYYPGCAANIEYVQEIMHKGTDFHDFFEDNMEMVKDAIWYSLHQPE